MGRTLKVAAGILGVLALAAAGCANMVLPAVPLSVQGPTAEPALDPATWAAGGQEAARQALIDTVYGSVPPATPVRVASRQVVAEVAQADAPRGGYAVEDLVLEVATPAGTPILANVVLVTPTDWPGPHPVLILQTFCGNQTALDGYAEVAANSSGCGDGGIMGAVIRGVFGQYIGGPPVDEVVATGLALAFVFPGDFVPDSAEAAPAALAKLNDDAKAPPVGAIGAWAWAYSRVADVLRDDPRLDPERVGVWGHSRHGKSALWAAANDPRIGLVISHQSGTGGASLGRDEVGESIAQITDSYPHWFTPAYAGYAGTHAGLPVDQHQLLALVAPRPVLLGNARRDQWSDPHGAYRAAMAADPIYQAEGGRGLEQDGLRDFRADAPLAYHFRNGRHGVTAADWEAFLTFLAAHGFAGTQAP